MRPHAFSRGRWATTGRPAQHPRTSSAHHPGPARTDGLELADEAEAFMNGTLAKLRAAQKRSLPPWMMINLVAHGDAAELHRLIQGEALPIAISGTPRRYNRAWALAQRSLALQVLGSGRDAEEIRHVQHAVLVPLELRLISQSTAELLTLGRVLADAIDALDQHRPEH